MSSFQLTEKGTDSRLGGGGLGREKCLEVGDLGSRQGTSFQGAGHQGLGSLSLPGQPGKVSSFPVPVELGDST